MKARQFHEADDVADWRVVVGAGACAYFRTESFSAGVRLVQAISQMAEDRRPAVDIRHDGVTVRLAEPDLELARQISAVAQELGVPADPSGVQKIQVSIDALVIPEVMPFWRAVLGYTDWGDEDLIDPHGCGPSIWFQQMDAARTQRNRIHIDVYVAHDQGEARVAAALAAGGRLVSDEFAPSCWVLADPEGNEACIGTWLDRD
jgi:4a-hydroxytetrahydrobiopterin dehydratase